MRSWVVLALFVLLFICAPSASAQQTSDGLTKDTTLRVMELVLPSEHLLGSWDDLRSKLEDAGITPRLVQITDVAGNPSGGLSQGATQASGTELSLLFDLEKTSGLKGGSVFASFSQRWGTSLSLKYIDNVFGTQQIYGFETFRIIDVSYQQKLFDDRVEVRLGRFATTDDFYVSPYYVGFISNAFCGNPIGILLDAPGMTAYTGTWAALAKVEPTARSYVMGAVYNGDPTIRANKYHGVNLSLKGPPFAIGEVGYKINGLQATPNGSAITSWAPGRASEMSLVSASDLPPNCPTNRLGSLENECARGFGGFAQPDLARAASYCVALAIDRCGDARSLIHGRRGGSRRA